MIRDKRQGGGDDALDVKRFKAAARDLLADVDDLPDRAADFGDGVATTTLDLLETVERLGRVTDRQIYALENMARGVARWLERSER